MSCDELTDVPYGDEEEENPMSEPGLTTITVQAVLTVNTTLDDQWFEKRIKQALESAAVILPEAGESASVAVIDRWR